MGGLISEARKMLDVSTDVERILNRALERRNYITHSLFKDRAYAVGTDLGRRQTIDMLRTDIESLIAADDAVTKLYLPLWEQFGVTEADVERYLRAADDTLYVRSN